MPQSDKKVCVFLVELDKRIGIPHEYLRYGSIQFCQQRQHLYPEFEKFCENAY